MLEVIFVLVSSTYPVRKFILEETGIMGGGCLPQSSFTTSYMPSYFSRDYSVCALGGYLFGVGDDDVKGGVVPITIYIYSHKVDCCVDGVHFVSS